MSIKIAFSTVGCPEWSLSDILPMAKDLNFRGVEIRGLGSEIRAPKATPFTAENLAATMNQFKKMNLEIPCLSSSCCLKLADNEKSVLAEGFEYIDLAGQVGASFVRLLADKEPAPEGDIVDDEVVIRKLHVLAPYAQYKNVTLLLETNGVYADTARLKNLLDRLPYENVAALWDIHHPYRYYYHYLLNY